MSKKKAFGNDVRCEMCQYEENCSLREIAPDLYGCMGHGKIHHRYVEEKKRLELESLERQKTT